MDNVLVQLYLDALAKKNHKAECGLLLKNGARVWITLRIDKLPEEGKNETD